MDKTYISITITYYSTKRIKPEVHYYRDDGVHPREANQLMWELVKLGGENTFKSNMYNNAICERKVTFWGRL